MAQYNITLPFTAAQKSQLRAGDQVYLSGVVYTARDAAHQRLIALLEGGKSLPLEVKDAVIYYAGPAPTPPGRVIGSIGPTTSGRMDAYTPRLLSAGLAATIGKGQRSSAVRKSMMEHQSLYFAATGGAAALLARCVVGVEMVAWPELGAEALRKLQLEDMPLVVINDIYGQDLYDMRRQA